MSTPAALRGNFGDGFGPGPERRRVASGMAAAVLAAALCHIALFGLLSVMWSTPAAPPPRNKPIEVSLVDTVALDQHAPSAAVPPAQSRARDPGPPAYAPPPAAAEQAAPEPTPPQPKPKPAPPSPKPVAQPVTKPAPAPLPRKPVKVEKPVEKPKPAAKAEKAQEKPAPAARPATAPATKAVAVPKTTGTSKTAKAAKPTGSLLDDDFRKGLTQAPSKSKAPDAAPGAVMNAAAAADIGSAIKRQVQPCANRQVNPGPGASRIVVTIRLQLNRDGTLAARPSVADDHGGVDDENRRYVDAVDRNAVATFTGCAPLRGLPPELYDVPRGWKTFILRYKLPG